MIIYTNPTNRHLLDDIPTIKRRDGALEFIQRLDEVQIIFSDAIPATVDSKTEFEACNSKFCEYNVSQPSAWEIFCGYVRPKKEINILVVDERKFSFMSPDGPVIGGYR